MYKISLILSAVALVIVTGCQDGIVDTEVADASASQALSKNGAQRPQRLRTNGQLL